MTDRQTDRQNIIRLFLYVFGYEELILRLCHDGVEYKKMSDVATMARGVRVVRSQLTVEGQFPVYQNSMTPLGYYGESNCNENTAFIISAGAAGEIGYSTKPFWAADDCWYFICPDFILLFAMSTEIYFIKRKKGEHSAFVSFGYRQHKNPCTSY